MKLREAIRKIIKEEILTESKWGAPGYLYVNTKGTIVYDPYDNYKPKKLKTGMDITELMTGQVPIAIAKAVLKRTIADRPDLDVIIITPKVKEVSTYKYTGVDTNHGGTK